MLWFCVIDMVSFLDFNSAPCAGQIALYRTPRFACLSAVLHIARLFSLALNLHCRVMISYKRVSYKIEKLSSGATISLCFRGRFGPATQIHTSFLQGLPNMHCFLYASHVMTCDEAANMKYLCRSNLNNDCFMYPYIHYKPSASCAL